MEGILSVPPERNIISRGTWKNRWVVLAEASASTPMSPTSPVSMTTKIGNFSTESFQTSLDHTIYIFKSKSDSEPLVVYPCELIQTCYVGDVAQRKTFGSISKPSFEPLIPTLIVQLKNSVPKPQRRKSHINIESLKLDVSREPSSFSAPVTLLFRVGPAGQPSLAAWAKAIQTRVNGVQSLMDRRGSSPTVNVISKTARSRNTVYGDPRSDSKLPFRMFDSEIVSNDAASSRLSLRSDSSESNTDEASLFSGTASTPLSPAVIMSTSDDEDVFQQLARHRSYTVDAFPKPAPAPAIVPARVSEANSPESKKESILDRAFKLNYIPSSPTSSPIAVEELTSVARFEALSVDLERVNSHYNYFIDQSVMPSSFFEDSPRPTKRDEAAESSRRYIPSQSGTVRALSPFGNRRSVSECKLSSASVREKDEENISAAQ